MGIQKWWNFTETKRFQFRFEMFNAFNHPNFFEPDTNLGDSHFRDDNLRLSGAQPAVRWEVLLVTNSGDGLAASRPNSRGLPVSAFVMSPRRALTQIRDSEVPVCCRSRNDLFLWPSRQNQIRRI